MGEQAVESTLGEAFKQAILAALTQYGAGTVLLIIGIILLFYLHEKLWYKRLKDKDKEIERLAEERDRYQDMFLAGRLSTNPRRRNSK